MIAADDPRHGTPRGYYAGCREMCCRRARARDAKRQRLDLLRGGRSMPALGAQRRIQALMRLGWTTTEIAHAAGWAHRNRVRQILYGQKGKPTRWLTKPTHDTVVRVYEELSMRLPETVPGPDQVAKEVRSKTRKHAERAGWPPPLAWDDIDDPNERPATGSNHRGQDDVDEAVVWRVLGGETLRTTRAEKDEIVRRWVAKGGSEKAICERLGLKAGRYGKAAA